jgi:hypothetical protein
MTRRARTIAATISPVRRLVMMAVLLAFAFQAYVVQTHLHGQPAQGPAIQQLHQDHGPAKPLSSDPLNPATCKLCQELIHSGAAITPAGSEFVLLLNWTAAFIAPARLSAATPAPQPGWQSRAPPLH